MQGRQSGLRMEFAFRGFGPGIAALLLSLAAIAASPMTQQSAGSSPAEGDSPNDLSVGTTICVALTKTIDAKSAKSGDAISARVTLPVLAKGKVFLANDAKISGHVVSAKVRSDSEESEVAIVFDHATIRDGSETALSLTVQAIGKSAFTAEEFPDADGSAPLGSTSRSTPTSTGRVPGMVPPSMSREGPAPASANPDSPDAEHPALDTGSHGAVGLPNLTLTESQDAASGSVIQAAKKNVKLESGMEMILRVVQPLKADKQVGQN